MRISNIQGYANNIAYKGNTITGKNFEVKKSGQGESQVLTINAGDNTQFKMTRSPLDGRIVADCVDAKDNKPISRVVYDFDGTILRAVNNSGDAPKTVHIFEFNPKAFTSPDEDKKDDYAGALNKFYGIA